MIVKQTLSNHLKVLWIAAFTTVLYIIGWSYFIFDKEILLIFLSFYILTVVPSFYLHVSYLVKNKGMVCEILQDRISINNKGKVIVIEYTEIKEVVIYKS